jgi:NTP pyrophosphatase (non-canonical NTP hydrolase)
LLSEEDKLRFINGLNVLIDEVILNSKNHGNYPEDKEQAYLDFIEEINEFKEAYYEETNTAEELADIFLSGFILASKLVINIPEEILNKHEFNLTRPYGHKRSKNE